MRAGRMRHRIKLYEVTNSTDSLGAPVKTWTEIAEVSASIDSVTGREYFASERDLGEETWKITLREVPGVRVDGSYRAEDVDTGATFDIVRVLESHARESLVMTAKAGSSNP